MQLILRVLFCVRLGARHFARFMAFVILIYGASVQAEEHRIHSGPHGYEHFFVVEGSGDSAIHSGAIHDLLDLFEDRHPDTFISDVRYS